MTNDELTKLWEDNKRFVYKMAGRYTDYAEFDDLVQEGYIGIYLAFTERKKADNKCQKERKMKFKKASKIKGLERKLKREKVNIYARNA